MLLHVQVWLHVLLNHSALTALQGDCSWFTAALLYFCLLAMPG